MSIWRHISPLTSLLLLTLIVGSSSRWSECTTHKVNRRQLPSCRLQSRFLTVLIRSSSSSPSPHPSPYFANTGFKAIFPVILVTIVNHYWIKVDILRQLFVSWVHISVLIHHIYVTSVAIFRYG